VKDFPKPGIVFKDVTPLLLDPKLLAAVIAAMAEPYRSARINRVVSIESRGFLFGVPIALELGAGLVPIRKPGKLPAATQRVEYALEYGTDALEMHHDAVQSGEGVGWHQHNHDVFEGCERFFRPGYNANLLSSWLPALDGVVEKLERGVRVADVGCGHGSSTILMAKAFPNSTFVGSDYHEGSIATARKRAREAGLDDRVTFEVAPSSSFSGSGYDLVTMFDCLHDMGDPAGAARHVRSTLAADGTWMIVEPAAGDRVEDNLNPVGRAYYGFSTLLCTPASLSQDVGLALGAQAGEARIRDVVTSGGLTRFRRAAETPFNLVFEARP